MSTRAAGDAASVSVSCWGEQSGESRLPGVLRVRIAGQSAGGAERRGDTWAAYWYAGLTGSGAMRDRITAHATAEEAVRAVIRSPWSRRLGGRVASPVSWTAKAARLAGRQVTS